MKDAIIESFSGLLQFLVIVLTIGGLILGWTAGSALSPGMAIVLALVMTAAGFCIGAVASGAGLVLDRIRELEEQQLDLLQRMSKGTAAPVVQPTFGSAANAAAPAYGAAGSVGATRSYGAAPSPSAGPAALTAVERSLLPMMADGLDVASMAARVGQPEEAVVKGMAEVRRKLGVYSNSAAADRARELGLI